MFIDVFKLSKLGISFWTGGGNQPIQRIHCKSFSVIFYLFLLEYTLKISDHFNHHRQGKANMDNSRSIELKIMHARGLQVFNFFQKLSVYIHVSITSDDPTKEWKESQPQRTPTDREGDANPEWNHPIRFDLTQVSLLDCDHLYFQFDLRHEGMLFGIGDRTIGEVRVPLKDLMQETPGIIRFVDYEIRTPDRKPNGELKFAYTMKEKVKDMAGDDPEITGYPINHDQGRIQYPWMEAQTSSSGSMYPPLVMEVAPYPPLVQQNASNQNYYPPPEPYYPQLQPSYPPPPPPLPPQIPAPVGDGMCYCHPQPTMLSPWPNGVYDDYGVNGNWNPTPNGFQEWRQSDPYFLDGRR